MVDGQGLDFRKGLKTTEILQQARQLLREKVPFYQEDRFFAPDIEAAQCLLQSACLNLLLSETLLPSYLSTSPI